MMNLKIKPQPDFGRMEKVLRRQGEPDRVPFYELFCSIEEDVLKILGKHTPMPDPKTEFDRYEEWYQKKHVAYMHSMGYDYVIASGKNFAFPVKEVPTTMTDQGVRGYFLAESKTIENREDFDKYTWPVLANVDYSLFERISRMMPDGMKVIANSSGVLENVMWLLGYEGISFLLYENPDLVKDMFNRIGELFVGHIGTMASLDCVGAVAFGEDMGFKTQIMLSPKVYREYVFPWHRKIVAAVHKHNKPIILHSCGNLSVVMDDIIACGWDAKHSFEVVIGPVWEQKKKYGDKIALMGGFDMNKICQFSEDEVRKHTRYLIEQCAPGGGWALGTGNSVANYVPVKNFMAMLDEGFAVGKY
jgi:uroporphyrinogen decarboxylase